MSRRSPAAGGEWVKKGRQKNAKITTFSDAGAFLEYELVPYILRRDFPNHTQNITK
jgi:hypothetical protein